jgi:tetratricopeptide (TPR) repeat protein
MSAMLDRKLQQAAAALAAGDLARADHLSREVLERAPRHPRALQLAAAVRLQQEDGAGAGELLQRALAGDPDNPQLLEGLGAAALKAGKHAEAESWLRRALASGKSGVAALTWLGLAVSLQGRSAEAVDMFRQAAARAPTDPGVHLNLAHELMRIGRLEEAVAIYQRALALKPDYADALNGLGSALKLRGELEGAIARFRQAIARRPDYAEAHDNLGAALMQLERDTDAEASFRQAIAAAPANADYQSDLGHALAKQQRWDEAIAQYERALALRPDFPEALNSQGSALYERGTPGEAIEPIRRAIALRPDYAEAHDNLANALLRLGREGEATASFRKAIALQPDDPARYFRFGNALVAQYRWDEAVAQYQRALELDPACADAEWGLANVRLFQQKFELAWPGYEQRLKTEEYRRKSFRNNAASLALYQQFPHWQGPREPGVREVAVWAEQGIGDQVLFSTLIPELIGAGVKLAYEMDHRLLKAYERSFPGMRFVARQEPPRDELQQADRVLRVGSLPGLFRRSREDFAGQPAKLLHAMPDRVAQYRKRLEALGPVLKVALSWRSARKDWWVSRKSLPLADCVSLLTVPAARFVDVQYGDTAAERRAAEASTGVPITRFEEVDHFNDLEGVLAILEACDLLITTSNATAHFAGALGKRTWLIYLADRAPFHYWAHGGSHRCLWYPSVEIVTAPHLADWGSLIEHVTGRLDREAALVGIGRDGSAPRAGGR